MAACRRTRLVTRVQVRLPLAEPEEPEPPAAEHVEAAAWLLTPAYMVAMLVLEATGAASANSRPRECRDLDETRQAWLVRAAVSKTRRARWFELPADLYTGHRGSVGPAGGSRRDGAAFPGR